MTATATLDTADSLISALGLDDIEMPLTPERVWRAIRAAPRA